MRNAVGSAPPAGSVRNSQVWPAGVVSLSRAAWIALGAPQRAVRGLVLREAMRPVLVGLGAGLLAALAASRLLAGLLFGVRPADPLTFGVVTMVFVGAALVASYLPARRATRMDPMAALRTE